MNAKKWIDQYIYSDIHEIFFVEFPIVMHEWFSSLVTQKTNFQRREMVEWSAQLIHEITSVGNPISRVFDFWVDSILKGYITEFLVEMIT